MTTTTCETCEGDQVAEVTCPRCNGTGEAYDSMTPVGICRRCNGAGVVEGDCETCGGSGTVYACDGCGRPEEECSRNPCDGVLEDRAS